MKNSIWTKENVKELKKRFPNENTRRLALSMAVSYGALKKKASRLRLKKSRRYLRSIGR